MAPIDYYTVSVTDFFFDTPWCHVPKERLGTISVQPLLPRGRLLGGSSKPSKLAALAAARKKKQEEAKIASTQPAPSEEKSEADKAVSLLDRLNVKEKDANATMQSSDGGEVPSREPVAKRYPLKKRATSPELVETKVEEDEPMEEQVLLPEFPDIRTGPSTFASTLCGRNGSSANQNSSFASISPFPNSRDLMQAFKGPSPDDIVLRAQAKGAVHG
jgi:elongation factor 1 alpha-like protein